LDHATRVLRIGPFAMIPSYFMFMPGVLPLADAEGHAATHPEVSAATTGLFAALLVLMILALAFEEKLHARKSIITGVFAAVCLLLGAACDLLPFGAMVNSLGESIEMPVFIPAIDWGVMVIIFGAGLFVDVTSKSGIFTWIAIKLTKASRGDPIRLLIYYGVMTVVFSAMLNNVTAMIIVGSLTAVSLTKLNRGDALLGFLLIEGLLTNVGGLLTLISSVPNIIVGNIAGISFVRFFLVAAPYVVVATAMTIWLGRRIFRIESPATEAERQAAATLVTGFDENDGIESRRFFNFCLGVFVLFVIALSTTSILPYARHLGMGYVALTFAIIVLLAFRSEVGRFYAAVDWDLLGFFACLFVVINVMEHAQVLALLGRGIGLLIALGDMAGPAALTAGAAVASSVTDNIPLSAMLAKILAADATPAESPLWWCVIFGSNLGGNITPIGSASTVVAVTIIHKHKLNLSFAGFVKAAVPFAALQIALATIYVLVFLR
ncbi:MAG: SLC13 family permease, partial [Phycisphaerae bacterium]